MSKPGCLSRLITFSHFDQIGSTRRLNSWVWIRNEAWPIQVMPISPLRIFGNSGRAWSPERLVKSEGMRTSVRKLRLCQSALGISRTRVEGLFSAPFSVDWRTMFLLLFFEKGIGTVAQAYKLGRVNQRLSRQNRDVSMEICLASSLPPVTMDA